MYKIVGADNREYGPVSQEEMLQWIAAGRANAQTMARFQDEAWRPLATFDEFKAALNVPSTGAPPVEWTTFPKTGARANTAAITGLVSGILAFVCCCCPFVPSLLAVVCGAIGLNQIKTRPHAYTTDASLAKIAIGLGIAGILLHVGLSIFGEGLAGLSGGLGKHLKDLWR
jgi:hypothetical protein